MLQLLRAHSQIDQCADKHVAADPAKDVQIKGLHRRIFLPVAKRNNLPAWISERIDLAGCIPSPETIVNVDDHHAASATIQHPEQSRKAAKVRSVTDAGGNRNDRPGYQARDYAGQSAFHACHHDYYVRFLNHFYSA